jgi:ketosteroid isomerase-like protein
MTDAAAVVLAFIEHINAHDVDGIASALTPDHRFTDSLGTVFTGREALRKGWRGYFALVADYHITVGELLEGPSGVVLVGQAAGRSGGETWRVPAAWRAVVRDNQVAEWQVYADNKHLRASLRRAPKVSGG